MTGAQVRPCAYLVGSRQPSRARCRAPSHIPIAKLLIRRTLTHVQARIARGTFGAWAITEAALVASRPHGCALRAERDSFTATKHLASS